MVTWIGRDVDRTVDAARMPENTNNRENVGQPELITALADLPEGALLSEAYLAETFRVTDRTVRRMVARGELPPPLPIGSRPLWLAGRVMRHFQANADRAEEDARKEAARIREMRG